MMADDNERKLTGTQKQQLRPTVVHADPAIPIIPPIVHTSSYRVRSVKHFQDIVKDGGYAYIRLKNPTCEAVEKAVNELEGGYGSIVFGSGMAAISTALLAFLQPGDHMVAGSPLYGCTHELLTHYIKVHNGVDVTFVNGDSVDEYKAAIRHNTKLLYGETPSNPILSVLDMEAFGKLSQEAAHNIITVVDTTFASPFLLKPILYGVDVVIHSATKYLGGHDDLCAGVVTTQRKDHYQTILGARKVYGGILSPHDASLLLRGIRTIGVRMERQCDTAHHIALFLNNHPAVCHVHYPGLVSHPQHQIAAQQMDKFGAMVAFEVKYGLDAAITVVNSLRTFQLALSLGGVDSLVEHPATMTHGPLFMSDNDRKLAHIEDGLIRLSIGLEDVHELVSDLQQALDRIQHLAIRRQS
jgi:cystathionine beta-lyase/cystathionine gamma-synthase